MPIPVLRSKIIPPRRRSELLSRQRLLDLLYDLLDYKLVILAAPAGYGKTSLLIDFADQSDLPVCWYALDTFDRDIQRFVSYFIASIRERFPAFGLDSSAVLESANQSDLDIPNLVSTIVNEVYEHIPEHFLLVLDDYHLVHETGEIEDFINRFIQYAGENCHLVLSSRSLLTLPDLPLFVAHSQVGGLSSEELAFEPKEIQALVLKNYHMTISDAIAEDLVRESEGWITGMLLSAQTVWQGMVDRLRVARVSGVGLYDYLAQQVLDQQPLKVRDFLLRSSVMEELDTELCDLVLGKEEDWASIIDNVLQNNLFVIPIGEDGRWMRYHHLFREFLQARLQEELPDEKNKLLYRLGAAYAARGEWEKAYAAYQNLGESKRIADLILKAGPALIKSGRPVTLVRWIDALPEEILDSQPNLISLRAVAALILGEVELGVSMLDRAQSEQRAAGNLSGLASTLVRRADAHRSMGNYTESIKDAQEALGLVEDVLELESLQAGAERAIGVSFYHLGQAKQALEHLGKALSAYTALDDHQMVAMLHMELGIIDVDAGRYGSALEHYEQSLGYWKSVRNRLNQADLMNNLGVLYHLTGAYKKAESLFEEALELAKQTGNARMEAYVLCSMGDLYSDLVAHDSASDAYFRCTEIAHKLDVRFLLLYAKLGLAVQSLVKGDLPDARKILEDSWEFVYQSNSQYELGMWNLVAGRLALAEGNPEPAIDSIFQAVDSFSNGGQKVENARARLYLAKAIYSKGDEAKAIEELAKAFRLSSELESQHILVVAGQQAKDLLKAAQRNITTGRPAAGLLKQISKFESSIPAIRRRIRPQARAVPFAPPKLTIQALGKTLVELDGQPVNVPEWQNQRRVRELFYYLLTQREGLSKEAIGLIFWPESSDRQLKLQFKNAIYRLRHALGQDILTYENEIYSFNWNLDYEYDVEYFLERITAAQAMETAGDAAAAMREALAHYKGPYLPEVEGTWVLPEREALRRKYVEATLALARLSLEEEEHAATLELCNRILLEEPFLEEAHRLAMRAYASRGDRMAVTRQYECCRKTLWEELNVLPSPQTEDLYAMLRS